MAIQDARPAGERLATLEANYNHLNDTLETIRHDQREMLEFMQQAKGGWRMLMLVSAIGGAVGGVLVKLGLKAGWV